MTATLRINSNLAGQVQARAQAGVGEAARMMVALTVPLTPILHGHLRQSIGEVGPVIRGGIITAGVRSKGLIYARRQHEETGWVHPRGGQAKYLATAMEDGAAQAKAIVANHIKGAFS